MDSSKTSLSLKQVLFNPGKIISKINSKANTLFSIIIALLGISSFPIVINLLKVIFNTPNDSRVTAIVVLTIGKVILFYFLSMSLIYALCMFFGGKDTFSHFISVMGFTWISVLFMSFTLFLMFLFFILSMRHPESEYMYDTLGVISLILILPQAIWGMAFSYQGVKQSMELSKLKAAAAYILPLLGLLPMYYFLFKP